MRLLPQIFGRAMCAYNVYFICSPIWQSKCLVRHSLAKLCVTTIRSLTIIIYLLIYGADLCVENRITKKKNTMTKVAEFRMTCAMGDKR